MSSSFQNADLFVEGGYSQSSYREAEMGGRDKNYQFTEKFYQPTWSIQFIGEIRWILASTRREERTDSRKPPSVHACTKLKGSNSQLCATLLDYETLTTFSLKAKDLVASNQDYCSLSNMETCSHRSVFQCLNFFLSSHTFVVLDSQGILLHLLINISPHPFGSTWFY